MSKWRHVGTPSETVSSYFKEKGTVKCLTGRPEKLDGVLSCVEEQEEGIHTCNMRSLGRVRGRHRKQY